MSKIYRRNNSELQVALYVCENWAERIVRENNGITMGGLTLAEKLVEMWNKLYVPNNMSIYVAADAVRHWVTAAGINKDDEYEYIISSHIINA